MFVVCIIFSKSLKVKKNIVIHTHPVAPSDYTAVSIPGSRYKGGSKMDTVFQFTVNITSDTEEEEEESFFITYIPIKNALVIPPTTEVKICGGEQNNYTQFFKSTNSLCRKTILCKKPYQWVQCHTGLIFKITIFVNPLRSKVMA